MGSCRTAPGPKPEISGRYAFAPISGLASGRSSSLPKYSGPYHPGQPWAEAFPSKELIKSTISSRVACCSARRSQLLPSSSEERVQLAEAILDAHLHATGDERVAGLEAVGQRGRNEPAAALCEVLEDVASE